MALMADDDYALALRLQEEFDCESAISVRDDNTSAWKKWPFSGVAEENRSTPSPVPSSLIDSSWELIDPNPDARALFLEFNDKYFWGSLGGVEVRWSPRMTLCAGVCVYEGRGGMCSIRLSEPLLKLRPRKDLVETLLHEMIHAYLFVTDNDRDRDGHGPQFLKHMHRLNKATGAHITVYHSFHDEVDNYRTHWWRCDGPCKSRKPFFGYVKRAMNRAPSSRDLWWPDHLRTCGGTFTKIKEPEDYGVKKNKRGTQQEKTETSEKAKTKSVLANWLQGTSTQPNSSGSSSGKGLELIAKGSGFPSSGNSKSVSAAAGAPDIIDVEYISDDELLSAVDEMEKKLSATQQQTNVKSNDDDNRNVHGGAKCISDDDADLPNFASEAFSVSSDVRELPQFSLNKFEFPGKGVVLGQKSSTSTSQPSSSSAGQVLRRLPGIGLVEVRGALTMQGKVGDAEIREAKDAGRIITQKTDSVESDEPGVWNHTETFSHKLPANDKSCTNEGQSKLNRFISKDSQSANVDNRRSSNNSTGRIKQPRKSSETGSHKTKTDIRFWLSDQSRAVGEVVRVPNFISVGNPRFRRVKDEQENAAPSLKIPRHLEDNHNKRPAKKIRLDNEITAPSNRHVSSSDKSRGENGACGSGANVNNGKIGITDNSKNAIVENGSGRNVDNSVKTVGDSKGVKADKGKTTNMINSQRQNADNACRTDVDNCRTIANVSSAANGENSRARNVGSGRIDSLAVRTDSITLCSDDSDFDETQTIASVISRIKASVSFDDVASEKQDGSSTTSDGIASVEPPQAPETISSSVSSQNSHGHSDSALPNQAPCPACGVLVDIAAINEHLDLCLS